MKGYFLVLVPAIATVFLCSSFSFRKEMAGEDRVISHELNPYLDELRFFWKNKDGENYRNFQALKADLKKEGMQLLFAMNGGMYQKDLSPQGLYIEKGVMKKELNQVKKAYGNFYLQPNGVFYVTKENKPVICITDSFKYHKSINYATQSGPMLLIDGKRHPAFRQGSANLHIRNGVGILPNGNLLFAISKERINFFDFATYFLAKGCKNALYLDGFVSRAYIPSQNWLQMDGNFGVIIAEIKKSN